MKEITMTPVGIIHSSYIRYFDFRENVTSGWVDKHFENGSIPDKTIVETG